jgi:hypothetical protein
MKGNSSNGNPMPESTNLFTRLLSQLVIWLSGSQDEKREEVVGRSLESSPLVKKSVARLWLPVQLLGVNLLSREGYSWTGDRM